MVRLIALLALILGIVYFYLNIFSPSTIPVLFKVGIPHERINILIMGTDLVYDRETHKTLSESGRSDTLMVAHIDPETGKIILLSIPRDTLADVPGYGRMKVNAAHNLGGPALAMETVSKLLGLKIDKYILFHPSGVIKMIDLMGGIRVYVDKDMYYVDKAGGLYVNLKKGWHHLSGEEAHGYLRFRMDPLGDINRVQRQQGFLGELIKTMAKPSTIARFPWVIGIAKESIETDLPLKELLRIGNFARGLPRNSFKTMVLPGAFSTESDLPCFWISNNEELEKVLAQYFNKREKTLPPNSEAKKALVVSIYVNNDDESSYIPILRKLVDSKKYVISNVARIKRDDFDRTHIIADRGDEEGARELGGLIGISDVIVSGAGDVNSDYTIILCKDFKPAQ